MPRFIAAAIVAILSGTAQAGKVCHDGDDGFVCLTDQQFREHLDGFDEQYPHAPLNGDEFLAIVQEARTRGGTDALLVDSENRFRAAVVQQVGEQFKLVRQLGIIAPPLRPIVPPPIIIPPIIRPFPRPMSRAVARYSNDIYEDGDNTDGQELHGPPGSAATWGCTGYSTNDTCKACCMATRTLLLAPIVAWAKYCHGVIANVCLVASWICHAACAASEAAMLGVVWYSADQCNDNCEDTYWNDQSVDWQGAQHHSLRQSLETGEYKTCEGWVDRMDWGGSTWLVLSEDYRDREGTGNCAIAVNPDNDVTEELYWGAGNERVRVVGTWPWDFRPVDYRIVDIDPVRKGRQIPFVGVTGMDDDGAYITLRRTGEKLYLDGRPVFESLKVWVWGDRSGNRLQIKAWNILWWDLLEGAF